MSLKETIKGQIKEAMQNKDAEKLSVLRMLLAAILNKEKTKRAKFSKKEDDANKLDEMSQLSEEEIMEVIASEIKARKDSIEQYQKGNRQDLADKEKNEMEVLVEYMPEQMSEDEIRKIIKSKIEEMGATGPQDMGKVMGAAMPQLKGKADGSLVSEITKEELSK